MTAAYRGQVRESDRPAVNRRRRQPPVEPRLRRARVATSALFLVQGLVGGVWMARIPAIKAQAHLSDGTLGAALFAVPAGLMLGSFAAERVIDRVGSNRAAWVCGIAGCLLVTAPGAAANLPELMAGLFAFGFAGGMWDVAQNAQGLRVESAYGRPVITSMHACYSFGAIAGSLAGGGFAWAGVAPFPSLAATAAVGILSNATCARWLLPGTAATPGTHATPADQQPGTPPRSRAEARRIRRLIIAIAVIGICGIVGEGAAGDWSAVYLKDNLGTSAAFAALGFAAFSATMTIGRALGDQLILRFGVVPVARAAGLVGAAGLTAALAIPYPAAAITGWAVLGAGLSVIVPQAFAAGGRADPDRPGSGIAKVVGLSYAGLSAGPAVIGAVASQLGLRLALGIPALLALGIAIGAPALAEVPRPVPPHLSPPGTRAAAAGIP